jgi:hypothetical protein
VSQPSRRPVILSLVCLLLVDAAHLAGPLALLARDAIPAAAILMPARFFLCGSRRGTEKPNRLILLLYLGAISLAVGVVALGIGLLAG